MNVCMHVYMYVYTFVRTYICLVSSCCLPLENNNTFVVLPVDL